MRGIINEVLHICLIIIITKDAHISITNQYNKKMCNNITIIATTYKYTDDGGITDTLQEDYINKGSVRIIRMRKEEKYCKSDAIRNISILQTVKRSFNVLAKNTI